MIAALPMYDRPETSAANDALWALTREALGYGPDRLTRDRDLWDVWLAPDLVLSQTCNLPYRLKLHGKVRLVGCPDYGLEGCAPGQYSSVLVARAEESRPVEALLSARVVINQGHSQSGYGTLWAYAAKRGLTPSIIGESGAHMLSARMVAAGEADLACIDAQSWRLIARHDEAAAGLRVLDRTDPSPATPFVTGLDRDPAEIAAALAEAIDALPGHHRAAIDLKGLVPVDAATIMALPSPPDR